MSAICLTFAESVENHIGNQQIGKISDSGWDADALRRLKIKLDSGNVKAELYNLNDLLVDDDGEDACVLVIKNGVNDLFGVDSNGLFEHLKGLEWDKHYYDVRRKKVLNKIARWNLCFGYEAQTCNYEEGMGTVYKFEDAGIQNLKSKIENLMMMSEGKGVIESLNAEGNYYYNLKKCGIGMHGDTERRKVFGINLGDHERHLVFEWYKNSKSVSEKMVIKLHHGDCYIMSDKAVGYDWKKRSKLTIRHGAGIENSKYIVNK